MRYSILFCLVIGCLFACKTTDDVVTTEETSSAKIEELVFGLYYGRCVGDCTHFYKLQDGQLFKDAIEGRYDDINWDVFASSAAPTESYDLAKGLMESIPDALLESRETTFGSPNVVDQGTMFITAMQDGTPLGPWKLDPRTDQLPTELHVFQTQVKEAIDALMN